MPLSEDEQRILTEIEQQLYASDPALARHVSSTTIYSGPLRTTRMAVFGLLAGLAALIVLLPVNVGASFVVGFGIMFASALRLEHSVRHLGSTVAHQLTASVNGTGVRDLFGVRHGDDDSSSDDSEDDPRD